MTFNRGGPASNEVDGIKAPMEIDGPSYTAATVTGAQYVCMDHITADRFDNDEKRKNKESQQNINLKIVTTKRFEPTPFSDQRLNLAP
jgi:hypothetical protein